MRSDRVVIFPFAIQCLSEMSGIIAALHFHIASEERIILGKHILTARSLDRAAKLNTLCHGQSRCTLAQNVDTALHCLDGKGDVLIKIVAKHDGIHQTAVDELVEIGKYLYVFRAILEYCVDLLRINITDSYTLNIRM